MKSKLLALRAQSLRSAKRFSSRPYNKEGVPLFTRKECDDNFQRGWVDAGGNWEKKSFKLKETPQYTEEDIINALEKEHQDAKKYCDELTGNWDSGFKRGKAQGKKEVQMLFEQNTKALIEESQRNAYTRGLAANPDFVHAKQCGRQEGEREGRQKAQVIAEEKLSQIIQETNETIESAKESALSDYRRNRKISTRLMKPLYSVFNWFNEFSGELKGKTKAEKKQIVMNQFKKMVLENEVPLSCTRLNMHRPAKNHLAKDKGEIGWSRHALWEWEKHYSNKRNIVYEFVKDRLRLKDFYQSKIISAGKGYVVPEHIHYTRSARLSIVFRILGAGLAMAFLTIGWHYRYKKNKKQYLYGQTEAQYVLDSAVQSACTQFDKLKIAPSQSSAFAAKITACKLGCDNFRQFHEKMRIEMKARRVSGIQKDPRFFGNNPQEAEFKVLVDEQIPQLKEKLKNSINEADEERKKMAYEECKRKRKIPVTHDQTQRRP